MRSSRVEERKPGTGIMRDHVRRLPGVAVMVGFLMCVPGTARAQSCYTNANCNDGIACTTDTCVCGIQGCPGECWHISNCADAAWCNGVETCCTTPGGCGGYPVGTCLAGTPVQCPPGMFCSETLDACVNCRTAADCNDGNPCTTDACSGDPLDCSNTPKLGSCTDNDLCTVTDACQGVCQGGSADGLPCTGAANCPGGVCVAIGECAGTPKDCEPVTPPCHDGWCSPATGNCVFMPYDDGTWCNDDDLCTAKDRCDDGVCVGGSAGGCITFELTTSTAGPFYVGDVIDVRLYAYGVGCTPSPGPCGSGTVQPVASIETLLTWDPEIMELADPREIGEPNPEDECDDSDPCNYNCGWGPRRYNWGNSLFSSDCDGDAINYPCEDLPGTSSCLPGNDGDAYYTAFMQITCGSEGADPACVSSYDYKLWVTTFKFKAIGATAGGPTAIAVGDCLDGADADEIAETRTKVGSGSVTGLDILRSLGDPKMLEVKCVSGDDCPLGVCLPDGTCLACPAPTVTAEGSRYFAVTPPAGVPNVGINVRGVEADVDCVNGYVWSDGRVLEEGSKKFQSPAQWGTVHVRGERLMAGRTYEFRADCNSANPGVSMSAPASAKLWRFGDADNDTTASILDVVHILDGFRGIWYTIDCQTHEDCKNVKPHKYCDPTRHKCLWSVLENVDLIGAGYGACGPERIVSIVDATYSLDAFRGFPDPCRVTGCR